MLLLLWGSLALGAVLAAGRLGRQGVPLLLAFLLLGMLAGSEGIGGIQFEDYSLSFRIGTVALIFILFDGGLNARLPDLRQALLPAGLLATVGVLFTCLLTALCAYTLGLPWPEALLIGAIVAPTDAAAVFSVLQTSGVRLRDRLATVLELESGLNDPLSVILTIALTTAMMEGTEVGVGLAGSVLLQLVLGGLAGYVGAKIGEGVLRLSLPGVMLYPVLTLCLSLLIFALTTLIGGSGFLAVYVSALLLNQSLLPERPSLVRVHNFLAWSGQLVMFLALGLLIFPSQLWTVADLGLELALALVLIARPLTVFLLLAPLRFSWKEMLLISWVGLRGAVPIVLATIPLMAGLPSGLQLFNLVFFVVVVSVAIQGTTVRQVTARLGMQDALPPPPPARVEIVTTLPVEASVLMFCVEPDSPGAGKRLADIDFPEGSAAILVVRDQALKVPRGSTVLEADDYVHVMCHAEDHEQLAGLFRRDLAAPDAPADTAA